MIELKINEFNHRQHVIVALAENGYTVRVVEKKHKNLIDKDFYVVILETPIFPEYAS